MNYQIIPSLGPASREPGMWQAMLEGGASGFRLNTSHLSLTDLDAWLERLEPFLKEQDRPVALTLDLQGSKWRLGEFDAFELVEGQKVNLVLGTKTDLRDTLPVPHADFFSAAQHSDGQIVLNDGKVRLKAERIEAEAVEARVVLGGEIVSRKGITLEKADFRVEAINEKDRAIFARTQGLNFIRYAISYLKDGDEMEAYRKWMGSGAYLIAKLERKPAMQSALRIATAADELWVCRGDLGSELGLRGMAEAVHEFNRLMPVCPVPVILAGQVLEHMADHTTPTRSEVTAIYDALVRGYAGVVLSDETAVGKYPIEAVRAAAMFRD